MYISYFDESGDDGFPARSSDIFVLTSVSIHYSVWENINNEVHRFRKELKRKYNFPVNFEFHTREFLMNKSPYRSLNFDPFLRKEILFDFFDFVSKLDIRIINSAINKSLIEEPGFKVLKAALRDNIHSIDKYIRDKGEENRFLIITDEGRVGKMITATRQIRKMNSVLYEESSEIFGSDIKRLIEDPLPKNSKESNFIQIADMVAYIIYLYICNNIHIPKIPWSPRLLQVLNYGDERSLIDKLGNILHLNSKGLNKYGIVINSF